MVDKRGVLTQFDIVRDNEDITLDVEATVTFGIRGVYHGPPEKCYPDEPDEVEYKLTLDGKDWGGTLTDAEDDRLTEMLIQQAYDEDEPDPPSEDPFDDYCPASDSDRYAYMPDYDED